MTIQIESLTDHTITLASAVFETVGDEEALHRLTTGDYSYVTAMPFPGYGPGFKDRYQAAEMLSKYPFEIPGVDREAEALAKFLKSEQACAVTNAQVWQWTIRSQPVPPLLLRMRGKLRQLLGQFSWAEAADHCGFGPGSSRGLTRKRGASYYKLGPSPTVTLDGLPVAAHVIHRFFPAYWRDLVGEGCGDPAVQLLEKVTVCQTSLLTTVPKNARTDRVICIEPTLNMFLQKGIGGLIRARMRKAGVDLNHQQLINRRMAYEGSCHGLLATIDLSAASDSISQELVEFLFPPDWVDAILRVRTSRCVLPDGSFHSLEKVSAMGNGNTFELESVLFLALLLVCCPGAEIGRHLAVYGDDLIVPSEFAEDVLESLSLIGFTPNQKKTFIDGPFRESCGKHYYGGEDVTPIYIREKIDSTRRLCWFTNSVLRLSLRDGYRDASYRGLYDLSLGLVPKWVRKRCRIPDGVGDGGIVTPFDEAVPRRDARGRCGWNYAHFVEPSKTALCDGSTACLDSLYRLAKLPGVRIPSGSIGVDGYTRGVVVHTTHHRTNVILAFTPSWPAIGPWY